MTIKRSVRAAAIALILVCVPLTACSAISLPKDVQEISVVELQRNQADPVLFVDVRTPGEYRRDRIGDSPLVPIQEIEGEGTGVAEIEALIVQNSPEGKPVTVILYCERGFRSARAQKVLEDRGIRAISLAGGIQAWRKEVSSDRDAEALQALNHI